MKYLLSVFLSFMLISTAFAENSEAPETTLLVVYSPSCAHCHEWMKNVYPVYQSYKKEVSKNYTVSIAYNKGAYQVIPKKEVKSIGR